MHLRSKWSKGTVRLAVVDALPIEGVEVVIANDIAEEEIMNNPVVESVSGNEAPMDIIDSEAESPICVVTRAKAKELDLDDMNLDVSTCMGTDVGQAQSVESVPEKETQVRWERSSLQEEQKKEFKEKESATNEPME